MVEGKRTVLEAFPDTSLPAPSYACALNPFMEQGCPPKGLPSPSCHLLEQMMYSISPLSLSLMIKAIEKLRKNGMECSGFEASLRSNPIDSMHRSMESHRNTALVEGGGTLAKEDGAVGLGVRLVDAVGKGELELGSKELLDVRATDVLDGNLGHTDDLEGPEADTVAGSHVLVAGSDGVAPGHLTVLLVHVVGTGAGVVPEPDTVVLDGLGAGLGDLVEGDDLTSGLLDLLHLPKEVPEAGLGNNLIRSKEAHAEKARLGLLLGGKLAANDLVLVELEKKEEVTR